MASLRILVPVKRAIDYAVRPRVNKAQTAVEVAGVRHSMNPFDEISVEEAVRLREGTPAKTIEDIVAVSIGPAKATETLRTAMAIGCDRGLHVEVPEAAEMLEPLQVAKILKEVVDREKPDLIIMGKQSIDDDFSQTGQILAGLLGWGQAYGASEVKLEGDTVTVRREVDGGTDVVKGKLPLVITSDLRLNIPRFATLPNIMKAKKKKIEKMKLEDFQVRAENRLKTLKVTEPPVRQGGGTVENVDGLISRLKELGAL
ncbi:electron transfer flavoprotein subunit beta [Drechslerella stenobrocha 248]|uniref:Probable electron transfer flavoprotein subunit beta n=1 Tax=Drechslerella stenobrocha 248 TaxID=1043628 RepID=W7I4U5_9PEZI|nr:electron transfer flavoprotein subunit beta [Drechslerella stenobrocha 248]